MSARLQPDRDAVARAIALARRFSADAAVAPDAADRLAVIVEEWTANIVEHGRPKPGSLIGLRLARMKGVVRLTFTDAGVAFDPRRAAADGPNLERGGGAGIALIRSWSRIAHYRRDHGRNRLALELDLG